MGSPSQIFTMLIEVDIKETKIEICKTCKSSLFEDDDPFVWAEMIKNNWRNIEGMDSKAASANLLAPKNGVSFPPYFMYVYILEKWQK